jgi:hypothetical protein
MVMLEPFEHDESARSRHHHVDDDKIGPIVESSANADFTVRSTENPIAAIFQDNLESVTDIRIIVDDEDCGRGLHAAPVPNRAGTVVATVELPSMADDATDEP